jgi:uroporphyrinogen decarboxylase
VGSSGAEVIGIDWRIDLATVRERLPGPTLQGNMDPTALFCPPAEIERRVHAVLRAAGPRKHIFNLGHGVLPETDPEHVRAMVQAVRSYKHA